MAKNEKISHDGIVESITDGRVSVRIKQTSACDSCKIASRCTVSESKEKSIVVSMDDTSRLSIGQQVVVSTLTDTIRLAVTLSFILPLILMTATVVAGKLLDFPEQLVALFAVGILIPYYIIIWLQRHRISRKELFQID